MTTRAAAPPYTYEDLAALDPLDFLNPADPLPTPEAVAVALAGRPIDVALGYVERAAAHTGRFTPRLLRTGYLLLHPEEIRAYPHD